MKSHLLENISARIRLYVKNQTFIQFYEGHTSRGTMTSRPKNIINQFSRTDGDKKAKSNSKFMIFSYNLPVIPT